MTNADFDNRLSEILKQYSHDYMAWMFQWAALVKEFDKDRTPIADAAWFLFGYRGFGSEWLKSVTIPIIRVQAKTEGEAAHKMARSWTIKVKAGVFSGLGIGLSDDAFMVDSARFHAHYPHRQETADAAEFLAMRVGVGAYWLKTVGAQHIREDSKDFRKMLKSKEVQMCVTVHSLKEETGGGYIDLKFFKGDVKVGETRIEGKTESPYKRYVELTDDFDRYRLEATPSARYSLERVKP